MHTRVEVNITSFIRPKIGHPSTSFKFRGLEFRAIGTCGFGGIETSLDGCEQLRWMSMPFWGP